MMPVTPQQSYGGAQGHSYHPGRSSSASQGVGNMMPHNMQESSFTKGACILLCILAVVHKCCALSRGMQQMLRAAQLTLYVVHMIQGYGMPAAMGCMPAAPQPMLEHQHCQPFGQPFGTQFEGASDMSYAANWPAHPQSCVPPATTAPVWQQHQLLTGEQQQQQQQQQFGFAEWQAQQQQQLSLQQQPQQQQRCEYINDTTASYHYAPAAPEPQRGAGHQVRAVQLPLIVIGMPVFTPDVSETVSSTTARLLQCYC
eukprot:10013-Heterococcus_DN1.PRE.5